MEARHIAQGIKEGAINKFRYLYNRDPNDEEMAEIERIKDDSYSTALALESTILGISNSLMFGKALRSMFRAAEINRGLAKTGTLAREFVERQGLKFAGGKYVLSEAEQALAKSGFKQTLWSGTKTLTGAALVEGVWEEGLQFATEVGVAKYYADKLDNELFKLNYATIPDVLASAKYAIKQQFTSVEGLESMILGALSAVGIVGARRMLTGKREEQAKNKFMEYLNDTSAFSTLRERLPLLFQQANAARELDNSIDQGDFVGQKLAKDKTFFYNALSRAQKGAIDVFIDELNTIAEMSDEEFESAFGKPENGLDKRKFIDSLIEEAKKIDGAYKIIDSTMPNPFVFREDPKDEKQIEENRKYLAFEQLKADVTRAFYNTEKYTRENLELDNKIKEALGNTVSAEELVKMYTKEGVQNEKDRVQQEIKNKEQQKQAVLAAKDPITNKVDTRALLEIENQIKSLKKYEALLDESLNKKTPSVELLHAFATQYLFNNTTPEISYSQFVPIQSDLMQYLANKIEIGKSVAVYSYAQDKNNIGKLLEKNLKQQEQIDEALLRAVENDILEERKEERVLEEKAALEAEEVKPDELVPIPHTYSIFRGSFDINFDPNTKKYIVTHPYLEGKTLQFDTREEALKAVKDERQIHLYQDTKLQNFYIKVGNYYKKINIKKFLDDLVYNIELNNSLLKQSLKNTKSAEVGEVTANEPHKVPLNILFSSTVVPEPGTTIPAYHKIFTLAINELDKNQATGVGLMLITKNNEKAYGLTVATELEAQGVKDPIVAVLVKQDPDTKNLHFVKQDGSIGERVTYDSKIEIPSSLIAYTVLHDPSLTWKNGEEKYKVSTEEEDPGTELTNWLKKRQSILANNQAMVYDIVVRRNLTEDAEDIVKLSKAKDFKFSKTERAEIVKGVSLPENTYYIIANNTLYVYQPDKVSDTRAEEIYSSLIHFNLPVDTSKLDPDDLTVTSAPAARKSVSETVYFTEKPTENSISIDYKEGIVTIGNKKFSFSELEKNRQQVIDAIKELTYVIPENPEAIALKVRGKIVASTNNDFTYAVLRHLGSNNNRPGGRGTRARNRKANQATSQAAQQATAQQATQPTSQAAPEIEGKKAEIENRIKTIDSLIHNALETKDNYLNWSNVRDNSDTIQFQEAVKFLESQFNSAASIKILTEKDIEDLWSSHKVGRNKETKEKVIPLLIEKSEKLAELRALEEQYKAEEQQPTEQATPQASQQAAQQPSSKTALGAKLLAPDILTQKELEDKNLVETVELEGSELQEDVENFFQVGTEKTMNLFSDKISDSEFARKINNKSPEEKLDIISLKAAINNGLGIREGINEFFGKINYDSPVVYKFKFSYSQQKGIKIEDKSVSYINIKDDTLYNSVNNRLSSYLKNIEEFNKQVNEDGYFVLLGAYGHEDAANSFSSEATKELIDSKKIKFIDTESGKECDSPGGPAPQAAAGMAIGGITLGGEWEIVKEFVGPSHAKGGINITVGENGVRITKQDDSEFKAEYGLVIPASDFEQ
jgi:hypothetical protein